MTACSRAEGICNITALNGIVYVVDNDSLMLCRFYTCKQGISVATHNVMSRVLFNLLLKDSFANMHELTK